MKHTIFVLSLLVWGLSLGASAQTYYDDDDFSPFIGRTRQGLNLRAEASSTARIITQIPAGELVYVFSRLAVNGYYKVIYIKTGSLGWIAQEYVRFEETVYVNRSGNFQQVGTSKDYNPTVEIRNDSSYRITLVINDMSYVLPPHDTFSMTPPPGVYNYVASAPGVVPASGTQNFAANSRYSWTFYVMRGRY